MQLRGHLIICDHRQDVNLPVSQTESCWALSAMITASSCVLAACTLTGAHAGSEGPAPLHRPPACHAGATGKCSSHCGRCAGARPTDCHCPCNPLPGLCCPAHRLQTCNDAAAHTVLKVAAVQAANNQDRQTSCACSLDCQRTLAF